MGCGDPVHYAVGRDIVLAWLQQTCPLPSCVWRSPGFSDAIDPRFGSVLHLGGYECVFVWHEAEHLTGFLRSITSRPLAWLRPAALSHSAAARKVCRETRGGDADGHAQVLAQRCARGEAGLAGDLLDAEVRQLQQPLRLGDLRIQPWRGGRSPARMGP